MNNTSIAAKKLGSKFAYVKWLGERKSRTALEINC